MLKLIFNEFNGIKLEDYENMSKHECERACLDGFVKLYPEYEKQKSNCDFDLISNKGEGVADIKVNFIYSLDTKPTGSFTEKQFTNIRLRYFHFIFDINGVLIGDGIPVLILTDTVPMNISCQLRVSPNIKKYYSDADFIYDYSKDSIIRDCILEIMSGNSKDYTKNDKISKLIMQEKRKIDGYEYLDDIKITNSCDSVYRSIEAPFIILYDEYKSKNRTTELEYIIFDSDVTLPQLYYSYQYPTYGFWYICIDKINEIVYCFFISRDEMWKACLNEKITKRADFHMIIKDFANDIKNIKENDDINNNKLLELKKLKKLSEFTGRVSKLLNDAKNNYEDAIESFYVNHDINTNYRKFFDV